MDLITAFVTCTKGMIRYKTKTKQNKRNRLCKENPQKQSRGETMHYGKTKSYYQLSNQNTVFIQYIFLIGHFSITNIKVVLCSL